MKILIVEDEKGLLGEIRSFLEQEDHLCEQAESYAEAEEKVMLYLYDIALIDITLPGGSGLDVIRRLRAISEETGIIIISAKNSLDDKLTGLEIGADDYITKPFYFSELNARVKALARRRLFNGSKVIKFNEISIDSESKSVSINENLLTLTKKEYELLIYFISNKNRLLTRESIAEHLWGDNIDLADNFDFIYTHINNLRKKIHAAGGQDYLQTVYGMGYKFSET